MIRQIACIKINWVVPFGFAADDKNHGKENQKQHSQQQLHFYGKKPGTGIKVLPVKISQKHGDRYKYQSQNLTMSSGFGQNRLSQKPANDNLNISRYLAESDCINLSPTCYLFSLFAFL